MPTTSGLCSSASTASLSPWTTLNNAIRQARFLEPLCNQQRRRRNALGGFEDEAVAAGERDREHPHRHHGREVERRDPGHDPERLAQRVAVDPRATFSVTSPLRSWGAPTANSTTSIPRATSP